MSEATKAVVYGRQSSGKAKSIDDQIAECRVDAEAQGWIVTATYRDGTSASRYARKPRDEWARVLSDVDSGALNVLVLWESSRGDRNLATWAGLLERCRDRGVLIRVTSHERSYDLRIPNDWKSLANDGVDSHHESNRLSQRVTRGVASAARDGKPPMGRAPYGYRRLYDPRTGKLLGQEPDPVTAPIVQEIVAGVARSVPVSEIARDLIARGVTPPLGKRWYRQQVRDISLNVAYIGQRRHRGEVYPATWKPLVEEATFYAAGRVLNDPTRLAKARPGRQVHLLTYLAECAVCGGQISARSTYYVCRAGCVGIRRTAVDEFVRDVILARLVRPDAYSALHKAGDDADREVLASRGQAVKLRTELDGWRLSAARGTTTPESLAVIENDLTGRIRAADERARLAAIPPALRQVLEPGADVRARWDAAPVPARREIIRTLAAVKICSSHRNSYVPVDERVEITWRTS